MVFCLFYDYMYMHANYSDAWCYHLRLFYQMPIFLWFDSSRTYFIHYYPMSSRRTATNTIPEIIREYMYKISNQPENRRRYEIALFHVYLVAVINVVSIKLTTVAILPCKWYSWLRKVCEIQIVFRQKRVNINSLSINQTYITNEKHHHWLIIVYLFS